MFTQPCFIRKFNDNTIKKLEELGYHKFFAFRESDERFPNDTLAIIELDTEEPVYTIIADVNLECTKEYIDCGANEDMFFALAALKDDSDKNQWFISDKQDWYYNTSYIFNDFYTNLGFNLDIECNWHKATPQEIIEHFK